MVACDCVFDAKVHSSPFLVIVFFSYLHLLVQLLRSLMTTSSQEQGMAGAAWQEHGMAGVQRTLRM